MTKTNALAELRRLEQAARDVDAERGLAAHEAEQAVREAHRAREEVEDYWREVGAGAEPDEAKLKRLAAECGRRESAIVTRTEHGREVERSIPHEQRIRDAEARHREAVAAVHAFAREHRDSIEALLVEHALGAHRNLMATSDALRVAVREHGAAADRFSHIGVLATGRAPTDLPRPAPLPSSIRGQAEDIAPPVPVHCLTEAVVEAIRPTQPGLADQFGRKLADRARREEHLAVRRQREAGRSRSAA